MLIINIIKIMLLLLAIINLFIYSLSFLNIEMNWLVKYSLISEFMRIKLIKKINILINFTQKSIIANLFIIFIGMFICDFYTLYLTNLYIYNIEQYSTYYLEFIKNK